MNPTPLKLGGLPIASAIAIDDRSKSICREFRSQRKALAVGTGNFGRAAP